MSNKLLTVVIVLLVFFAFAVVSVDRDESSAERLMNMLPRENASCAGPTVEVSASETHKYEANEFATEARLELHGKDKELLFRQLTSRRASVFDQMKLLDVSDADIEQNSVEMRKEWSYDKGKSSLTGYVVGQDFIIKTRSRTAAAAVIAALSAELDVEILQTTATLDNQATLKKEAVQAVGKKALEKAELYAGSVGGRLGKVLSVTSGGDEVFSNGRAMVLGAKAYRSFDSEEASLSSIADSVEISASIHLVVELLQ
jgi:hypothetical protein